MRKRHRLHKSFASKGPGSETQRVRKESHIYGVSEQSEEPSTGHFSESQDGGTLAHVSRVSLGEDSAAMLLTEALPWSRPAWCCPPDLGRKLPMMFNRLMVRSTQGLQGRSLRKKTWIRMSKLGSQLETVSEERW